MKKVEIVSNKNIKKYKHKKDVIKIEINGNIKELQKENTIISSLNDNFYLFEGDEDNIMKNLTMTISLILKDFSRIEQEIFLRKLTTEIKMLLNPEYKKEINNYKKIGEKLFSDILKIDDKKSRKKIKNKKE